MSTQEGGSIAGAATSLKETTTTTTTDDAPKYWLNDILQLTGDTRPLFLADTELQRIYDVEVNLQKMDEARSKELDVVRERLRALSRQAETYRHSAQRPTTAPSQKQHEARLVELDTKKYGLAKTIADLEQAIASAETALGRSRDEAARTEREDPAAGFEGTIGTALKLSIYRELGFVPIEENGELARLLVKSDTTQDVHTLALDGGLSNFEYAAKAWEMSEA